MDEAVSDESRFENPGDARQRLVIGHAVPIWLDQTNTWLYNQIVHLPTDISTVVICERTANLDQFPVANIKNLSDRADVWSKIDRAIRRLRFRKHLKFHESSLVSTGAKVLHSHFGAVACSVAGAAMNSGVQHVVTFYGADATQAPRRDPKTIVQYRQLFRHAARILCEGPVLRQRLLELGCPDQKLTIQRLGVPLESIPFVPRKWDGTRPLRVLISGTFREKKGIPYALDALGQLQTKIDLEVTIIGDATAKPGDAEERDRIRDRLDRHRLNDKTRMLGFQPYKALMSESYEHDVFLSPSVTASDGDAEGGAPVTLIEMAASGIPIVSTDHCDIPTVILHGETGWLAAERDVQGLVDHVLWLADNPSEWNRLLHAGRQHVDSNFNATTQGARLAEIYKQVAR